jgi:hypothetical protein
VLPLVPCLDFSIFFPEGKEIVLKSEATSPRYNHTKKCVLFF